MPFISIWMIRLSLIYLLVVFASGSALLLNKAYALHPVLWALLPPHKEMALLGWILQFVLGTAYWMFPRYLQAPNRGNLPAAWVMFVTLNGGILLSAFSVGNAWVLFAGRLMILAAVCLFAGLMWERVYSLKNS